VPPRDGEPLERAVTDWLSGMTDRFALGSWEQLFVPRPWSQL
jgi:dGTPase